ncbi:Crp/Fnr family transcriptional regulator [Roseovarius spongiae]|uniref:Crp/Fnr family transcriptional regulator n=1 Tax=Roseovarius spongiae TaxID=2320272 RepID=A0A3A8AQK8_9RHOB|nr:Crp/Fnr family transcriptional regulator [Roseovarius spongiae]RKF12642.1 Crp/Fnr family transcriptional regulator [Roseovarius spongiae]
MKHGDAHMNCLDPIDRASPHTSLAAAVKAALRECDAHPVAFEKDVDIRHEGDRPDFVYLVKSGWLCSYGVLADGQRQLLCLHMAGDIAGLSDLGGSRALFSLRSLRASVVYPIPVAALTSPAFVTPAVTAFLLRKSAETQALIMRTLVAVGRMGARERIIWLLLMLRDRNGGASASDGIEVPLNQSELGDLVGLSNVSVSKTLCQLSDEGFIERKGGRVLLRRPAEMERIIGHEPMGFTPHLSGDSEPAHGVGDMTWRAAGPLGQHD